MDPPGRSSRDPCGYSRPRTFKSMNRFLSTPGSK